MNLGLEALDSTGAWRPIEVQLPYFCGVGLKDTFLPPGHVAITACRVYRGDYSTQFRVRLAGKEDPVSAPFYGSMNYSQFGKN